ncbi:minor capsid protein [Streptococcus sp. oral taxon 431]|uniref:minor capsid protein n=1 Tax=Streptococcus sp. oral taxon 431 TaxID=712633 RepID=UPI000A9ABFFA|nr:minor capsid protein [Streptococcus sp. oral taxon 431]
MKNKDYWTKRKANLIYEQMDKAEKQADKFDEIYKQSKAYLDKQINKVFDKFQRDYGLSERDARHVLKNMKDQKDLNELRKVLEARPDDPNIQRLLADLDSPAYAYRMKRLERLSADLDSMRESIYHSEKSSSDVFYNDLMKDSYYKATFDLQQQTGLAYSFSNLPETEIKRLQGLKWTGEAYSDRIWENTGALASSVKDELLVSLMTGRSVKNTSQAIAERFEVGQNNARRLVRTESAFFHNQMELLSYEDAEITKYRFIAVLDKRTSHICQEHDNKVYDTDKAVPGVNYPPLHPWCRSTTIAHDDDIDYSKLERRARNPETGKVEYVSADMSYKDWYSRYVAKDGEKVYNQDMSSIDLMAKQRSFVVGDDIRVNAKEFIGTEFDFWTQDRTKKIRDAVANVQGVFRQLPDYSKPTVVFLKKSKLPGLAGYDYKQDILFISDALSSEKEFKDILSDGFFAAKDIKDAIVHELTHKQHWVSAKAFYKANKKRYNSIEQAMMELNSGLIAYVKQQQSLDRSYLKDISLNAYNAFLYHNNINELVAEIGVIGDNVTDKVLLKKVKEVLKWK